ncbi:MAG TPA: S-methyl-5-thioribose-1-phosphate isomerase [Candidatus Hydrogenedentes bacterium]|mgnify:CR=1 FL=1|nr:S-methyl-5-thioribose-1-phosphate isomerase [Candidatus Hydrogenedentota bacterium]HPG66680.1 S-methyl-5-thioribose-1-phosphate isomerase [Candidatus Hydrogenedentota bacterium]
MPAETVRWTDDKRLFIIDQTLLPVEFKEIPLDSTEAVFEAIRKLRVRGAPAIGVCAALGVVVGVREQAPADVAAAVKAVQATADYLAGSRPTAVNLFWALDRMRRTASENSGASNLGSFMRGLESEAVEIMEEDKRLCRGIGEHGAPLIRDGDGVLTHCNAGGLATADYGTALAVMFRAHEEGRRFRVFADETRPLLQGARLTTWELMRAGIDVTLICDNMAGLVMREGKVKLVITGADRIAANGDAANKIGTYSVAQLAKVHGIPFYIAAPYSTFDHSLMNGAAIPIEERSGEEVTHGFGRQTAPDGVAVYNPAFDVTPADLIAGIITERGILRPPYEESIGGFV